MAFDFDNIQDNSGQLNKSIIDYFLFLEKKDVILTLLKNSGYNSFDELYKPIKQTPFGWIYGFNTYNCLKEKIIENNNGNTYYFEKYCEQMIYRKNVTISTLIRDQLSTYTWFHHNCKIIKNMNLDIIQHSILPQIFNNKKNIFPDRIYLTNDELIYIVIMPCAYIKNSNSKIFDCIKSDYIYQDFICLNPDKIEEAKEKYFKYVK